MLTNKTGFPVRSGSHAEWLSANTDPKFKGPVLLSGCGGDSADRLSEKTERRRKGYKTKNSFKKFNYKSNSYF